MGEGPNLAASAAAIKQGGVAMRSFRPVVVVLLVFMFLPAGPVEAGEPPHPDDEGTGALELRPGRNWYFGGRTGFYASAGSLFIGGEVFLPVGDRVSINPNVEWVFVDEIDGLATFNLDAIYDFPFTSGNSFSWLGAGVGVRRFAKGGGWPPETNLALNLLGGVGFGRGQEHMPFVQGKLAISDNVEFVLSAGFRF